MANLLQSEKWILFKEAIELTFQSWSALQLASESENWRELAALTLDYFQQNQPVESDHLEYNFYEWFQDECDGCSVEDNSMMQVSKDLILLHKQLFDGKMEGLFELRHLYKSKGAHAAPGDSSSEEEDLEMQVEKPSKSKPDPVIDDDGFELVQRKRK